MTSEAMASDLNQISTRCQPEKSKRDHLASRGFRRRVRAVSRKSVRSARSSLGPCRSPKHRSRRTSEHAALTHHVQPEAAGGRSQAGMRSLPARCWLAVPSHIFGHRARYSRAQGADIGGDRFRAGPAARGDRTPQPTRKSLSLSRTAPSENSPANRCC